MHNIGSHLDSTLKSRAANLHANNTVLEKQLTELQSGTKALAKETDKLKKIADDAAKKLKELGNVQNWAEVMEREMLILEETVRLANESEEEDYGPCRVCGKMVEESGDDLLWCRACDGEFHPPCVGLEGVPNGEWLCAECQQQGTYLQSVKGAETVPETAPDEDMLDETIMRGAITRGVVTDGAISGEVIEDDVPASEEITNGVDTDRGVTDGPVPGGGIANIAVTGGPVMCGAAVESVDIVMGGIGSEDKELNGHKENEEEAVVMIEDGNVSSSTNTQGENPVIQSPVSVGD
jgi:GCN5-like protein 1 (GCN5L1)/PHD-finger